MAEKSKGREVVLVVGVFDLFHVGHVNLLRAAREYGDRVVVVVNGDHLTRSYKRRPIFQEQDRLAIVKACRFVDDAEISNDYDVRDVIARHGITKIVHGDDWEVASYKRQIKCDDDYLAKRGVQLIMVPYTQSVSTSDIIQACVDRSTADNSLNSGPEEGDGACGV